MKRRRYTLRLPRDTDMTGVMRRLSEAGRVVAQTPFSGSRQWLDTFDWRIHDSGAMLEVWGRKGDRHVRLEPYDAGEETIELRLADRLVNASDLPSAVLVRRLQGPLGVRCLSPRCEIQGSAQILRILGRRDKTICRVEVWRPRQRGDLFVRVTPLRGYRATAKIIFKRLRQCEGARRDEADPLIAASQALAIAPGMYPSWQLAGLCAGDRTDDVLMSLLAHYARIMDLNVAGMAAALDSEFVHQFRIGLRRCRALLRHSPGTLAHARLRAAQQNLAWFAAQTGPVRDADVHELVFPAYIGMLKERDRDALGGLLSMLKSDRVQAHREFAAIVGSHRFRSRWRAWMRFVSEQAPRGSRQPVGPLPLNGVAGDFISAAARKVTQRGKRINRSSPPQAYHDLRKSCKNLRYLIDAYGFAVPNKILKPAAKRLKRLQELLGEHQDLDVHEGALREMHARMAQIGELSGETHRAMEALLASLSARAHDLRAHFREEFVAFRRLHIARALRDASK